MLNCVVTAHDDHFGLSTLGFDGGELRVPRVAAPTGAPLRVRIRARDVTLALSRALDVSASNQLTVTIERMVERAQTYVDIELRVGNSRLLALVTKESVSRLALRPGLALWAMIKSVALDARTLGVDRPIRANSVAAWDALAHDAANRYERDRP